MIPAQEQEFYRQKFECQDYQLDNYLLFLENSTASLMRSPGKFGMIIPNPWLTNLKQRSIRRRIFATCAVEEIVHFTFPVFKRVTVDTEIVLLAKPLVSPATGPSRLRGCARELKGGARSVSHLQGDWIAGDGAVVNISVDHASRALASRIRCDSTPLSDLMEVNVGIKPYQVGKGTPPQTRATVDGRPFDADESASIRLIARASEEATLPDTKSRLLKSDSSVTARG